MRESEINSGKLRKTADGSYIKPKGGGEKHKVIKDEHKREMVYESNWIVGTDIVKNGERTLSDIKKYVHKDAEEHVAKLFNEGKIYKARDKKGIERYGKCLNVTY